MLITSILFTLSAAIAIPQGPHGKHINHQEDQVKERRSFQTSFKAFVEKFDNPPESEAVTRFKKYHPTAAHIPLH